MAHEITIRENGKAEMAYLNGVYCWHGLGNELTADASIEDWIEQAGMDWKACRARVRYATGRDNDGNPVDVMTYDNNVVLFRSDTRAPLGIVSDGFQIVQPGDVMEFWRDLTGAAGMQLQTAGTLFGGRKLWALAKVGEASIIDPKNTVRENLVIATALDGSMATEAFYCSTVVVCNNTLRAARGEGTPKVKINHRSTFDPQAVKSELGVEMAMSTFERTIAAMRELAEKRMRESDVIIQSAKLFRPDYDDLDKDGQSKVWRSKPVEAVSRLALDNRAIGSDLDGMSGTAWQWLNSVTEYVDHAARAKTPDHRMDSAFFGKGAELKERAYAMAVDYTPSLAEVISATNDMFNRPASDTPVLDAILSDIV